jgi:hypothetical protein
VLLLLAQEVAEQLEQLEHQDNLVTLNLVLQEILEPLDNLDQQVNLD